MNSAKSEELSFVREIHCVRQVGAGDWSWNGVREKYCWSGWSWSWWLEWCERKILLGWSRSWLPNAVIVSYTNFKIIIRG